MKRLTYLVAVLLLASFNLQAQWGPVLGASRAAPAASLAIANAWKGGANGTSKAITVSPTAGNLLVVFVAGYQGTNANHAVTDNIGSGTWTKVNGGDATTNMTGSFWYQKNIPSGITTVTVNSGSGSLVTQGCVHEVSGASTSAPFTGGESNVGATGSTLNPQTGSATNATASSIFFAGLSQGNGGNPVTMTINSTGTVGTWNQYSASSYDLDGNTYFAFSVTNIVVSSSTAEVHGWAINTTNQQICLIAAFH